MCLDQIDAKTEVVQYSECIKGKPNVLQVGQGCTPKGDKLINEDSSYSLHHPKNNAIFSEANNCILYEDGDNQFFSFYRAVEKITGYLPKFKKESFTILRRVGQGSFCSVHKVWHQPDQSSGREFALKTLNTIKKRSGEHINTDEAYADLMKEAMILSTLDHKNIITLHGTCASASCPEEKYSLVMELLVDSLEKRLLNWEREMKAVLVPCKMFFNTAEVRYRIEDVALGIVNGMEYLHSRNIMHCDLKPANIGFDQHNTIKIFDFGLSRKRTDTRTNDLPQKDLLSSLQRESLCVGTPRYMAPEIANFRHAYAFSADVYSFGIVLWQLLTNQKPKTNKAAILEGKHPPLIYVHSKLLRQLLKLCWAANREIRPSFSSIKKTLHSFATKTNH